MGTSNAINANSAGIVAYNGTGTFSASPITNHNVLVAGTSNSITSVAPGATGTALCGNGVSADPSFQSVAGIGSTVTQHYSLVGGSSNSIVSVSPSTAGFVLTSNGPSADPSFQAPSSTVSGWVLLNTQTASNSASIVFSSTYINSTYANYVVVMNGVQPGTNGVQFRMDMSVNNGSTYLNSNFNGGLFSSPWNSLTVTNTTSTSTCPLSVAGDMSSVFFTSGNVFLYNLGISSGYPAYNGLLGVNGNRSVTLAGAQIAGSVTVNAIRFIMSSGNIATGTFSLYGISH